MFEAFNAAEIPVMVLKGAFLAQVVYPDIAVRTMNDADLLVRKEDLGRAKEEMLVLGYLPSAEGGTSHQHLPAPINILESTLMYSLRPKLPKGSYILSTSVPESRRSHYRDGEAIVG